MPRRPADKMDKMSALRLEGGCAAAQPYPVHPWMRSGCVWLRFVWARLRRWAKRAAAQLEDQPLQGMAPRLTITATLLAETGGQQTSDSPANQPVWDQAPFHQIERGFHGSLGS